MRSTSDVQIVDIVLTTGELLDGVEVGEVDEGEGHVGSVDRAVCTS